MGLRDLFRREQSSRDYPAAGISVTGDAGRFHRSKTTSARRAARAGQAWEDADRERDRKGDRLTLWRR